jgi:hypothetical protein
MKDIRNTIVHEDEVLEYTEKLILIIKNTLFYMFKNNGREKVNVKY